VQHDGQVKTVDESAEVLKLSDGSHCFVGDFDGGLFSGHAASSVGPLGLNIPAVAELLRTSASPQLPTGAAHLRWGEEQGLLRGRLGNQVVILAFVRQMFRFDSVGGINEVGTDLFAYAVGDSETTELSAEDRASVFDMIRLATVRVRPDESPLFSKAVPEELRLISELRRPSEEAIRQGMRFAVWPILALHVSP
jgi:hypothetical protein